MYSVLEVFLLNDTLIIIRSIIIIIIIILCYCAPIVLSGSGTGQTRDNGRQHLMPPLYGGGGEKRHNKYRQHESTAQ